MNIYRLLGDANTKKITITVELDNGELITEVIEKGKLKAVSLENAIVESYYDGVSNKYIHSGHRTLRIDYFVGEVEETK